MTAEPAIEDTIVAPITPQGFGAVAVVRLSGREAIPIAQSIFRGKDLSKQASHTLHFGRIGDAGKTIDEVLVALFRAPRSFTREDVVEISSHGSPLIVKEVVRLAIEQGARLASPGEFTRRAFINGRLDLAQAEAVADLIVAETAAAHQAAINQMRGGFSKEIKKLRKALIHFASLVELELDFAEEDVEFVQRDELLGLVGRIQDTLTPLINSFNTGNVIKRGVSVVIAGKANTGKSTLLNGLLNEERAIVSDVPGTTRDRIEDETEFGGVRFRFIDTAGLRDTTDPIEAIGVRRTKESIKTASLVIYLVDMGHASLSEIAEEMKELEARSIPFVKVGNKVDIADAALHETLNRQGFFIMSTHQQADVDRLKQHIVSLFQVGEVKTGDVITTNLRHYQGFLHIRAALERVVEGLQKEVSGELPATDIRQALHYLGELTGEITTDDLLNNIFSKFCIGK